MERLQQCFRALRRAASSFSPCFAACGRAWKAVTPNGVVACWLPRILTSNMYSPMTILVYIAFCLLVDLVALLIVTVNWALGSALSLAAVIALVIVFVRQGGIAASYPGVANFISDSIQAEMAGQVKRDFVSSVSAVGNWAKALHRAHPQHSQSEAEALSLLHTPEGIGAALSHIGFKEDSVHPEAPSAVLSARSAAAGNQTDTPLPSDNPLLFMASGQAHGDSSRLHRPKLLPPRRAILSLSRLVATARLQAQAETLTPYARRVAHDTAALLSAARGLAGHVLQSMDAGLPQGQGVPMDKPPGPDVVLPWPSTSAAVQSPAEAAVSRFSASPHSAEQLAQLTQELANAVLLVAPWLKNCPPLESPAGTPWQHLKRILCVQRCFPSTQTEPALSQDVRLVQGVRVLEAQPELAATPQEGGGTCRS